MPKVHAQGDTVKCIRSTPRIPNTYLSDGCNPNEVRVRAFTGVSRANLRQGLQQIGVDLHNSGVKVINCRLIGNCGTGAVFVEGEVAQLS